MKFLKALQNRKETGLIPVIPDIKCFSPKEGDLLRGRDPLAIARCLQQAGACVLSVVTETAAFHGSLGLLQKICRETRLPVLRKDFLETVEDLRQTKEAGASAVLLMYACLGKEKLEFLYREARKLDLQPFVETHTAQELKWAEDLGADLVGINNRNIRVLERDDGDVSFAVGLLQDRPEKAFLVVESALRGGTDVRKAIRSGADAVLTGTAILQADDPAAMYTAMTRPCNLKICGLMNQEGIDLCRKYGVDILGFVTEYPVEVPWNLEKEQTAELLAYANDTAPTAQTCIVTGGNPEKIISLASVLKPDFVQLHYTESLQETLLITQALHQKGIRVIRSIPDNETLRQQMFGSADLAETIAVLEATDLDALLLDSRDAHNAAKGGGCILQTDHTASVRDALTRHAKPLILGGGLTADTIRDALQLYSPDYIDIMTGSEKSPGVKAPEKLEQISKELVKER